MKTRTIFILPLTVILTLAAGSAFGAYSGGTGEPNNPYQITTKQDLLDLGANTGDYGKCFIMTGDIDMDGQVFTTAVIAADTISGSGFQGTSFTGTFDGNGHKVTHFTINGGSNWFLGLFGYVHCGTVKNFGVENCAVSGASWVGGLMGYEEYGIISNCYSTATVSGYSLVGGLVGRNGGSISNCYSTGAVSGSYAEVGGLVGENVSHSISDCYSTGAVSSTSFVGGLVGYNYEGSINNCYSTGAVSGTSNVGGLVGYNDGGSVNSSFWDTQTSNQPTSSGGTGKTTIQMKTKSTFTSAGWNFISIWNIIEGQTYPFFKRVGYSGGTGTSDDPYRIAKAEDLLELAVNTTDYSKCFILTADIDIQGRVFTTAIIAADIISDDWFDGTPFTGTFDGNGHKITHFTINSGVNYYLGLFGGIGSFSYVKNLGIENCTVSGQWWFVGGLAGKNYGSISNCYSMGTVSGSSSVGGLVGYNWYGRIRNCYSTGAVSGEEIVGGLVGFNENSTINDCYSTGAVSGIDRIGGLVGLNSGGSISDCYSTSAVNGTSNIGGLVGENASGSISSSFWDTQTSGRASSAGGTGKTTAQMKTLSTFTSAGWDFTSVWVLPLGQYPMLFLRQAGDLNLDGRVNMFDLAILAQHWLEGS